MTRRKLEVAMLLIAIATSLAICHVNAAEPRPDDITRILEQMAKDKARFDPSELDSFGLLGLTATLDFLLPETIVPPVGALRDPVVMSLMRNLGAAESQVRETATQKLILVGRPYEKDLKEMLQSDDPEVRGRVERILAAWKPIGKLDQDAYATAFEIYLGGIKDDHRLRLLAQRAFMALDRGLPEGSQRTIIEIVLRAVGRSGNERQFALLKPLLKNRDTRVAVLLVRQISASRQEEECPSLLLDALRSNRMEIVETAIACVSKCPPSVETERLLRVIFGGKNEKLKFMVSLPLMRIYGDAKARAYIIAQTQGEDMERVQTVLGWLSDAFYTGTTAEPALLRAMRPFLKSENTDLRRAACSVLGTYSGEDVIRHLIPMLGDKEDVVRAEAATRLSNQPDKARLLRVLRDTLSSADNPTVSAAIKKLIEKIETSEPSEQRRTKPD